MGRPLSDKQMTMEAEGASRALAESCPICHRAQSGPIGEHVRRIHGEEALRSAVLESKRQGTADLEIGARFGVTFRFVESVVTQALGVNVSSLAARPRRTRTLSPKGFALETGTVWSFRSRGAWATHDGRYRGNWSPYIPRNVILRYSQPGDLVLDYFCGAGTTAVESKLLGRRCVARDINPDAISLARENLAFEIPRSLLATEGVPEVFEPDLGVGDARDLSHLRDDSIDLICAHPPYADIVRYTVQNPDDLSHLPRQAFLDEMRRVAAESLRVLKPGRHCAILIGDMRRHKHVVPLGFETIDVFLEAGFVLRDLVIKRQHNCKTTGFWYTKSVEHNFLLLAHEYLPVFGKPGSIQLEAEANGLPTVLSASSSAPTPKRDLETTTVWIFPELESQRETERNLRARYAPDDGRVITLEMDAAIRKSSDVAWSETGPADLVHARLDLRGMTRKIADMKAWTAQFKALAARANDVLARDGHFVLETSDFRGPRQIHPVGLQALLACKSVGLRPREVIVVARSEPDAAKHEQSAELRLAHRYVLVFRKDETA